MRAELFRKAIEVIETRDWGKGYYFVLPGHDGFTPVDDPGNCPVCIWGALNVAAGHPANEWDDETDAALAFIDERVLPRPWASTVGFNDHPETTKAQIIDLLTRAAELCES